MADHHEVTFETEVCEHLAANGWLYSPDDTGYDRARALFPDGIRDWLEETPLGAGQGRELRAPPGPDRQGARRTPRDDGWHPEPAP